MPLRTLGTNVTALSNSFARVLAPSGDTTGATDTAAIQALWDAGKAVRLVAGQTYYVVGAVLKSGCHLYLNGATLMLPNGANGDVIVSQTFYADLGSTASGDVTTGINRAGIHGPGIIDGNKANQTTANTTITNAATLPTGTITVGSTTGFPTSGKFSVLSSSGLQIVSYTGITGTTFTGCTGGTGSLVAGTPVYYKGFGLAVFWRDSVIDGGVVEVRNCVADGLWTEWGTGGTTAVKADGAMENEHAGIKSYSNGRYGVVARGPHDSWWNRILVFANGVGGFITSGNGQAYIQQIHAWGTPQAIGLDAYTETHVANGVLEVNNVTGSFGLRINGVQVIYRGRVFVPAGGSPLSGNVGIIMRGSPTNCDIDAQVTDCNNAALVTISDGGKNRIRLQVSQTNGPAVVRFQGTVTSGSNGVNVNTFAGSGTLNVDDTTSWASSGAAMVGTASGPQLITYTGKTSTTLTGVSSSGSGVISTGHFVTPCPLLATGIPGNDILSATTTGTALDVAVAGGTGCPGVVARQLIHKTSGSIAPSATISTYGTPLTVTVAGNRPGLDPRAIIAFSAAGLATETLTFQVVATYTDGTTATVALGATSYGITTNGGSMQLDQTQLYNLHKSGVNIYSLAVSVRSTIANSTATVTAAIAGKF